VFRWEGAADREKRKKKKAGKTTLSDFTEKVEEQRHPNL